MPGVLHTWTRPWSLALGLVLPLRARGHGSAAAILSSHPQAFYLALLLACFSATLLALVVFFVLRLNRRLRTEMSDHQQALHHLRVGEQRFRLMVDVMASPLFFVRMHDGRVLYANRKAREVFMVGGGELSEPVSVVQYYVHPEERDRLLADVRAQGVVLDREILFRRADGEHFWGLVSTALGEWQGEPALVTGFVDITERKRFENALHEANTTLNRQLAENEQLQQQLRQMAVVDPLTGLYNRRHLEEALPREIARAQRDGEPLALVMLDIDHFKGINDRYGHLVGDQLLIMFAAVLRDEIRAADIACRYGGEEFLLMLPTLDQHTAAERAEHWRQRLEQTAVRLDDGRSVSTTVSLGVACYPEHGADWDHLVSAADQALYAAKASGRNRVALA